jgi:hypothetical protein
MEACLLFYSSNDPSFRASSDTEEKLLGMTGLRARKVFESQEPGDLGSAVEELIQKNLDPETQDWSELTRKVMRGVVENLSDREDSDWAIRCASQRAVLAVARRWGNIVLAGKASVVGTREAACNSGLDSVRAAQQAGLGAIEGVLQVGPVAYGVLQKEITPMVEDFQDVLAEERRSGEWMLRSLERGMMEAPLLVPSREELQESIDLCPEDYAQVEVPPALELPAAEPEPAGDFVLAPAAVEAPEPAPRPGLLQRFRAWLGKLFRGKSPA